MDPAILNYPARYSATDPAISNVASQYLGYLDLATRDIGENFINDFASETLKLIGFNERNTTTDVCLIHHPTFILLALVQTRSNRTDAEAQVISEAIAAFQFNNGKRMEHGLDPLNAMTIPAITMHGTHSTFFLVPVTLELSNAVIAGQHPNIPTRVLRCATVLTYPRRASTGTEDTEYRKLALKHFLAFKTLARSHWMRIFLNDVLPGPCCISSDPEITSM